MNRTKSAVPFLLAAALAALVALAAPSNAEAQLRLGLGGGPSMPSGDFDDMVDAGWHALAVVAVRLPLSPIALRGDLLHQRLPGTGDAEASVYFQQTAAGVSVSVSPLPLPIVQPYLIGGLGMYRSSYEGDEGVVEVNTELGANVGAGMRVNLLAFEAFVEARYHQILAGSGAPRTVPVTIGVLF